MVNRFTVKCECGCGMAFQVEDISSGPYRGVSIQIQDKRHYFTRKSTALDMVMEEDELKGLHAFIGSILEQGNGTDDAR